MRKISTVIQEAIAAGLARISRDSAGNVRGVTTASGGTLPLLSARLAISNLASHIPMQPNFSAAERGSTGTYHTTLEISGDVAYVQPIILVTRDPSDATYTSDDTYNFVGVAPTAALLDSNGQPNPTGGNSAWVTSAAAVFPRKTGASTSNPIPVAGPIIPISTIPRVDGGAGRLLMLRAYSQGASYPAIGATTRMPVYTGYVNDAALWDSYNTLVGQHKFYYQSGDYVSANQSNFSTTGTPATRWANSCIVGAKCMFTQPHVSVLIAGDSIEAGAHAQTSVPTFYGFGARAVETLRAAGYLADLTNCAVSGYSWDQFTPIANLIIPIVKPDVVIIPSYTPNGVDVGHTTGGGNTVGDALLHWAKCLTLRDTALANGAKTVIILTPAPFGATGSPTNPVPRALIRQWVIASGMPYVDLFPYAGADYGYNQAYRFDDQTHPNDVMNAAVGATLASLIRSLLPL